MPNQKDAVIRMIKNMPENISIEDIMAELYFKFQVEQGLEQLNSGKGLAHDDVKTRLAKWLEKRMVANV